MEPLPTEIEALVTELSNRMLIMIPYFFELEIYGADKKLGVILGERNKPARFSVMEEGEEIAKFIALPVDGEQSKYQVGKEQQIIKIIRIVLGRVLAVTRAPFNPLFPPYPEPEIVTVKEVEGRSYPRRFLSREWIHWIEDCGKEVSRASAAAIKRGIKTEFLDGRDNRTIRMIGAPGDEGWEFEILETKNI
jgi:hypothetical protein